MVEIPDDNEPSLEVQQRDQMVGDLAVSQGLIDSMFDFDNTDDDDEEVFETIETFDTGNSLPAFPDQAGQ